ARRFENPRFRRIETFSPRNHLHAFRFTSANEIDDEVAAWFAEAYRVGEQRHLGFSTVEQSLGSARVSRVGFGVSPKQASKKFAMARRHRPHARRVRYP